MCTFYIPPEASGESRIGVGIFPGLHPTFFPVLLGRMRTSASGRLDKFGHIHCMFTASVLKWREAGVESSISHSRRLPGVVGILGMHLS